jgi:hypothetical protein
MTTTNAFDLPILGYLNFLELTIGSTVALALRYVFWAGIAWLLGYWLFKRRWFHRKIVARFPQSSEVWREVRYSALSMAIFGLVAAATVGRFTARLHADLLVLLELQLDLVLAEHCLHDPAARHVLLLDASA